MSKYLALTVAAFLLVSGCDQQQEFSSKMLTGSASALDDDTIKREITKFIVEAQGAELNTERCPFDIQDVLIIDKMMSERSGIVQAEAVLVSKEDNTNYRRSLYDCYFMAPTGPLVKGDLLAMPARRYQFQLWESGWKVTGIVP